MAIFFALVSFFSWGVADVLAALASRRSGNLLTFFWALFIAFVLFSLYIPWAGQIADINVFVWVFIISLVNQIGTLYFLKGLELGNATLVITIAGSFALVTVLISQIFFHEVISPIQSLGIVAVIVGIILASLNVKEISGKKVNSIFSDKGVIFALCAFVGWGIYYAFIGRAVARIGLFWSYYPINFFFLILILFKEVRVNWGKVLRDNKGLIYIISWSVFAVLGIFSYYLGVSKGLVSIVAAIASASPILSVILTRIFFKEKLTSQQKIGVISSLAGIVLISFS